MRLLFCVALLFAAGLQAGEAQDRAAIEKAIGALNDPSQRAAQFTKDADLAVDFDRLIDLHRRVRDYGTLIGINETWTAMTVPRVVSGSIRFITSDVAIVDGASTVKGAVTLARRVPLLFVMKREGGKWRVSAVRVMRGPDQCQRFDVGYCRFCKGRWPVY